MADDEKVAHGFTEEQVANFREVFEAWDNIHKDKKLDKAEVGTALKSLAKDGEFSDATVEEIIKKADKDGDGEIDWDEFLDALWNMKGDLRALADKQVDLIQVTKEGGILHTYAQEEMSAFAEHLNYVLKEDKDVKYLLPIKTEGLGLCKAIEDGVLLCKFINCAVPDTIDFRAVNKTKIKNKKRTKLSKFKRGENNNLVVQAAQAIGVKGGNIGANDLMEGSKSPHLVLGVIWQIVKIQLLGQINLKAHPELIRLLGEDETWEEMMKLPADQLLLRWFNYHLAAAGEKRRVKDFGRSIQDGYCYTVLLNQLNPKKCSKDALQTKDKKKRAGMVIKNAEALGCKVFIKPQDIVDKNERLNLAFTASVFNHCPGLKLLDEDEQKDLAGMYEDDVGDSREERAFRMWINTLGIDDLYINNLFDDCQDGLVLLRVMDLINPGCVSWSKVEMKPKIKFKKVANCNYAVVLGKSMGFKLVSIQGSDITDGNKKLVLALVWQMMRYHSVKLLTELTHSDGKQVSDKDIAVWCNQQCLRTLTIPVAKEKKAGAKMRIRRWDDKTNLKNGQYFIYVLGGVYVDTVDWDLVTAGETEDEALLNARYAVSVARKMGCTIFLLPEDIVEAKKRMCMTFGAAVMLRAYQQQVGKRMSLVPEAQRTLKTSKNKKKKKKSGKKKGKKGSKKKSK